MHVKSEGILILVDVHCHSCTHSSTSPSEGKTSTPYMGERVLPSAVLLLCVTVTLSAWIVL